MSRRDRRDDRRDVDRRDTQPDQEQRRAGDQELQEGESLTALKAILAKVASLLKPLQLTPDESIRLVEQLYGSVLEMDVKLAGEADDKRRSSVLSHIQDTAISRDGDALVVEFPTARSASGATREAPPDAAPEAAPEAPSEAATES
jgi:hypothetical protein